jgi:preprotein translocase subunit SecG
MGFLYILAVILFLCLCLVLAVVVLIQESKTTGLGASFGGDAGSSLFGVSTPQVLKTFTAWLAGIFMLSCVLLSFWTSVRGRSPVPTVVETEEVGS